MKNYRLKTLPDILLSGGDGYLSLVIGHLSFVKNSSVNSQRSTVNKKFSYLLLDNKLVYAIIQNR